jgi:group II intron reverse transcriptase/maturase
VQKVILGRILSRENLNRAFKRVEGNKGAAGVDGMRVEDLYDYLRANRDELVASIWEGRYQPQPVRRVEIPKPDGGKRMLGVPTVIDRVIQQAIAQELQEIFEPTFSKSSFGFRPGRSAHQAIVVAKGYYEDGYHYVVDLDLAKYFDTVNHELLIRYVREEVKDEGVIHLIKLFLKSGVMIGGLESQTIEGVPQGGPLSPLLSNVYLILTVN